MSFYKNRATWPDAVKQQQNKARARQHMPNWERFVTETVSKLKESEKETSKKNSQRGTTRK